MTNYKEATNFPTVTKDEGNVPKVWLNGFDLFVVFLFHSNLHDWVDNKYTLVCVRNNNKQRWFDVNSLGRLNRVSATGVRHSLQTSQPTSLAS